MKHKTIELVVFVIALIGIGTALVMVYQNRKLPTPDTSMVSNPTATPNMTISPTSMVTPTNAVLTEYQNFKAYAVTGGSKPGWKKVISEKYKVSFEYPENPFINLKVDNQSTHPYLSKSLYLVITTEQSGIDAPNFSISIEDSIIYKKSIDKIAGPGASKIMIDGVDSFHRINDPSPSNPESRYSNFIILEHNGYYYIFNLSTIPNEKNKYTSLFNETIKTIRFLK